MVLFLNITPFGYMSCVKRNRGVRCRIIKTGITSKIEDNNGKGPCQLSAQMNRKIGRVNAKLDFKGDGKTHGDAPKNE
jgi:hypothetical protein